MSFYPQPNKYQCGPFALKYALAMVGVFKNEDKIAEIAGSNWWAGTDEIGLSRAARRFNCRMKYFQSSNPLDAKRALIAELKKGHPCVLSVSNWNHWVTVVNYNRPKFVMIDSELDKVISIQSPEQLLKKWRYNNKRTGVVSFDGYALYPKFKVFTRAKFTIEEAREAMYSKNAGLATKWDHYVNDLINICKPRTKLTQNYITFNEFLRRNENSLITKTANWHGYPTYAELKKIINNMNFVASVYDLIIPIEDEKKALIDLAAILMMYSCGKYGMEEIY